MYFWLVFVLGVAINVGGACCGRTEPEPEPEPAVCLPNPPDVGTGTVDITDNHVNSTGIVKCNNGSSQWGKDTITCQKDGHWSFSECRPNSCLSKPVIEGSVLALGLLMYHVIFYANLD